MAISNKEVTVEVNIGCPDKPNVDFMAHVRQILLDWMLRDAKTAASNRAYIGALILGVCALDVLGGFYAGVEKTEGKTFKDFIEKYLPNQKTYISSGVYENMRCNLVHGYSTEGYKYTDEFPAKHLQKDEKDGNLWIHIDTFIWEVETATRKYLDDLSAKDELWNHFKDRWKHAPLLHSIQN